MCGWNERVLNVVLYDDNPARNSPLSKVLDHQMAVDVKEDFLSNFPDILIIFKWHIPKDLLCIIKHS